MGGEISPKNKRVNKGNDEATLSSALLLLLASTV